MSIFSDTPIIDNNPPGDANRTQFTQGTAVQNTWYDALDISTSGYLTGAPFAANALGQDVEIRITIDGGATKTFASAITEDLSLTGGATSQAFNPRVWARFEISLKVEVRQTGSNTILRGSVYYTEDQ